MQAMVVAVESVLQQSVPEVILILISVYMAIILQFFDSYDACICLIC